MPDINSEIQKLDPSALIQLFQLDCTSVGGPVLHFSMSAEVDGPVVFGGTSYTAIDISFEGMETTGVGALPQPSLILANTDGLIQAAVNTYGDLNGCELTRVRTFARFLDGAPEADDTSFIGPDIFKIERKSADLPESITWELSAAIDQEGVMLPGRAAVRNTCLFQYRAYNGVDFDYTNAECPYTGGTFWDEFNQLTTDKSKDRPARNKTCCTNRFGVGARLPFGGFPGMGRSI